MYFGTEEQQRLQKKLDDLTPWVMKTPGACLTGRVVASDDLETLGWDLILPPLREDGLFAFCGMRPEQIEVFQDRTRDLGAQVFGWNGFMGDANAMNRAGEFGTRKARPTP